ncbi:hypothetical protein C3F09_06110 [candidate division GN15 bacterium]|uniref:DUF2231 domain-containing protein n=1 Tax=candidate division GN15 bacterium TaxID=2072418 RepID=A0A855X179_9BACT|nr:MAG: hypothetical protein C3F09_06110 [candidate division GN15 bacterium]
MFDPQHIHPMIVHFPIALIIVAFAAELVGAILQREFFTKVALLLLVLGVLGGIAAYISGSIAGDHITKAGALGAALEEHDDAATFALWTMIIVALIRLLMAYKKWVFGWRQWLAVILLGLSVAAIARTGYLGGELVFRHAAGVQVGQTAPAPDEDTH